MRKCLTVGTMVLAFAALAPLTFSAVPSFDWGIKLGLSSSRIYQSGSLPPGWTGEINSNRLAFGVYGALNLGSRFVVQPEVFYLPQGGGGRVPLTDAKILYRFDYLQVPILAKFRLMQGVPAIPVVFAGPSVGFLFGAKAKHYLSGVLDQEEDILDFYKKVNVGLVFGVGVDWKLGRYSLIFDARGDIGLTDISRPLLGAPATKTRALVLLVGVGF